MGLPKQISLTPPSLLFFFDLPSVIAVLGEFVGESSSLSYSEGRVEGGKRCSVEN